MSSSHNGSQALAISVVIPTHNRLATLSNAIESVLTQTYPVHELIIVDDGSEDGTYDWLQSHYPETLIITQQNQGVSHARNRGIEHATGDWIALLDSDDRWYPNKLARQALSIAREPHYRLCHCDEHWVRNGRRVNPKVKHRKYGGNIFEQCLPLCAISPSAVLLKRTLLDDVGLFDESLLACEDYDLWLRVCARETVLYVDEPLLEKTGGHDDQLSQRYPAMDRFRLYALAKLIRSQCLDAKQHDSALRTFHEKLRIFCQGAHKRHRQDAIQSMRSDYGDLVSPDFQW